MAKKIKMGQISDWVIKATIEFQRVSIEILKKQVTCCQHQRKWRNLSASLRK